MSFAIDPTYPRLLPRGAAPRWWWLWLPVVGLVLISSRLLDSENRENSGLERRWAVRTPGQALLSVYCP